MGSPDQGINNRLKLIFHSFIYDRRYDTQDMIEMDRFVHDLNGNTEETIVRRSIDSAGTMKGGGMTLER